MRLQVRWTCLRNTRTSSRTYAKWLLPPRTLLSVSSHPPFHLLLLSTTRTQHLHRTHFHRYLNTSYLQPFQNVEELHALLPTSNLLCLLRNLRPSPVWTTTHLHLLLQATTRLLLLHRPLQTCTLPEPPRLNIMRLHWALPTTPVLRQEVLRRQLQDTIQVNPCLWIIRRNQVPRLA
jgi:hypothetical protein